METNCIFITSDFVIRPQILISSVHKIASFPHTDPNNFFHIIALFLVYFCDQFVEIRHSCVCQQSTWYSATRTR